MKSLKEKIEVMQAALDGKEIEVRSVSNQWGTLYIPEWRNWDGACVDFNWSLYDYRIASKKPREWVLLENLKPVAKEIFDANPHLYSPQFVDKYVLVREVLPE